MPMLWLTLVVALLSALVPLGPPSSRMTGSAFSPATTSVAIKARAAAPLPVYLRVLPPPADPPAAIVPAMGLAPMLMIAVIAAQRRRNAHALSSVPARYQRARGPPASMD